MGVGGVGVGGGGGGGGGGVRGGGCLWKCVQWECDNELQCIVFDCIPSVIGYLSFSNNIMSIRIRI